MGGDVPEHPVARSMLRTLRFHVGTACFGGLIIAIVQFIRAIFAYIDRQTKGLQGTNKALKILMKVIQSCMYCLEKVLKWICSNAYILTACYGTGFCKSTKKAMGLILKNLGRMAVTNLIVFILLHVLGRLAIVLAADVALFFTITMYPDFQFGADPGPLHSKILPLFLTTLLSFYVGGAFLSTYATAIDTILICFCDDDDINDGSKEKPYLMSKSLMNIIGKKNKEDIGKDKKEEDGDGKKEGEEAKEGEAKEGEKKKPPKKKPPPKKKKKPPPKKPKKSG